MPMVFAHLHDCPADARRVITAELEKRATDIGRAAHAAGIAAPATDQAMFDLMREVNPSGCVGNPKTIAILHAWHRGHAAANLKA